MGCRHNWKPSYTHDDLICTKCGITHTRAGNPRWGRRRSSSNKKAAIVATVAGVFILALFVSGAVDMNRLVGVATDSLEDVTDSVVALNPDMAVEITQHITEVARTTQEQIEEAAAEAERVAREREAEAARQHMETARDQMGIINDIRVRHGLPEIPFDLRAYNLALARAQDHIEYDYPIAHTNPITGTCPDNIKHQYGFAGHEYAAENLAGTTGYHLSYAEAINLWMDSHGHRTNLLWPTHYGGAVACERGICVFLGINVDRYGAGCY